LTTLFRIARHRNIDIIVVSQRFYDLLPIIRGLTDIFYLFNITEPRDIDYISKYIGYDISERVKSLEPLHYLQIKVS